MRSATLEKETYIQDNFKPAEESSDVRYARIAQEAHAACDLPGNIGAPDFEEFILKYTTKTTSDFA